MDDAIYEKKLTGKLWCSIKGTWYPVCINADSYLQVILEDVEGESFTIGMLSHPVIGGATAFEFRSSSGRQVTGAGASTLRLSDKELPVPGPAIRMIHVNTTAVDPNFHVVKLQTLDSRFVTINERVAVVRQREQLEPITWSRLFNFYPRRKIKVDYTDHVERASTFLRMLEPTEVTPSLFLLQLQDPDAENEAEED